MATGRRLLSQVMPDRYRQGYTYPTKAPDWWREMHPLRPQTRMKRYGSKILRHRLKELTNQEVDE